MTAPVEPCRCVYPERCFCPVEAKRCPGCGVLCVSHDVEHLDNCPYQGRDALPLEEAPRCAPLCGASKAYGRYDQPWKHEPECPVRLAWEASKWAPAKFRLVIEAKAIAQARQEFPTTFPAGDPETWGSLDLYHALCFLVNYPDAYSATFDGSEA